MTKVSIIGAGTWALGLAILLHNNGTEVTMWSAVEKELDELIKTRENKNLKGVKVPSDIIFEKDLSKATYNSDVIIMAVASIYTRQTAKRISPYVKEGQIIVDVAKGIEESTLKTLSVQIKEEVPQADVAVLSGPSHAEEVSRCIPTSCVIGATTEKTARYLQNLFMSNVFRVYISPDILGIELGAALKNVIALAAGIADGLGYGDNSKAALITRGMAEISNLAITMGAYKETLYGLSGIGDLIVTCASMHSRNRRAGILIGKGKSMEEAMKEVEMVVEGVYSAKAAKALSEKYNVSMPIVEEINKVLFMGKTANEAVSDLMLRDKKIESSQISWK